MSKSVDLAITEARKGNLANARRLLSQAIKDNPNDARAWYLMSQVSEAKAKSIECLDKVLEIEPGNAQAIARLDALKAEPFEDLEIPPPQLPPAATPAQTAANIGISLYSLGAGLMLFAVLLVIGLCMWIYFSP